MKNILFIGGDKRMIYAAQRLGMEYDCHICAVSDTAAGDIKGITAEPLPPAGKYDAAVLPLPASRDGKTVHCPLYEGNDPPDFLSAAGMIKPGGIIFTSKLFDDLVSVCRERDIELIDYYGREELAVLNAVPTAEGAVAAAVTELDHTVHGSEVLILGYGRIGKLTASYFSALGAHVSAAARSYSALAWIKAQGFAEVDMRDTAVFENAVRNADIIINTVPAPIMDRKKLSVMKDNAAIIELASVSCVSDYQFAKTSGIRVITASGLPGKVAPVTSGYIIADTIENILKERSAQHGKQQ